MKYSSGFELFFEHDELKIRKTGENHYTKCDAVTHIIILLIQPKLNKKEYIKTYTSLNIRMYAFDIQ